MIKKIVDFSIDQPIVTGAIVVILVVFGYYSYTQVPVEAFPDPSDVQVQVIALWPGQAAEEMESQVSRPIEQVLNGTPGLTSLRSASLFGLSLVTTTFEDGTNDYFARQQVLEKMMMVTLPAAANWQLAPLSSPVNEVYRYVIEGPKEKIYDLRALQDWVIEPQFRQVPGVADVVPFGGAIKQYQVIVDPVRLLQHRVTLQQLFNVLQNNNMNTGGNVMKSGEQMFVVRSTGLLGGIADIQKVWVTNNDGRPIYVKDVADVRIGEAPREGTFTWFDRSDPGNPRQNDDIIEGIVLIRKNGNALQILEGIREKVKYMNEILLPRGVQITTIYDRKELVNYTVSTVLHNLAEGAILILFICLVFTSSLRASVVIWLLIPPALLTAFLILHLNGTAANLLSLGAVDFGILVDATVVVVEGILVAKLAAPKEKAFKEVVRETASKLGRATIFSQVIFIMALIPIFSFQRVEGRIFKPMALTMGGAMLGAIALSLLMVPMVASVLLRGGKGGHENWVTRALKHSYERLLNIALKYKMVTIGGAAILLCWSLFLGAKLGTEFLPKLDEGNFWIKCTLPLSLSKEKSREMAGSIRDIVKQYPEIKSINCQLGRPDDGTDSKLWNNIEIAAFLIPREQWTTTKSKERLADIIKARLEDEVPGASFAFSQYIEDNVNEALSGVQGELAIKLFGEDLKTLQEKGEELKKVIGGISGVADLEVEKLFGQPDLNIHLNRDAMARYGIDVNTASTLVQTGIGGQAAGTLIEGQRRFDITVRLSNPIRSTPEEIADLWIDTPTGLRIPLANIATIHEEEGASRIGRDYNNRRIALRCNIRGRDMGSFVSEAQKRVVEEVKLPSGYRVTWEGQFENQRRATSRLMVIVPLSVLGIVALLFWAFKQLRYALLILVDVPFALVGGIAILHFTNTHLSVSAMIGFIALGGVCVQQGLILVGQFNSLRVHGLPLGEAVRAGAKLRVRPVLMTALMAAIGMFPASISHGIGSEVQRPLALVVVGGMMSAVALTLFVLPALYEWIEGRFPTKVTFTEGLME
ncbi:MAG TPA: CusA/CzcA family heavy metal efflux RND transporter [Planctomycetota bacterium]|nr:CusA/CzcA family heavy metal efflux RND transporter [Planctomycetota bacterium]